jgi:hypothetical protein
MPKSPITLKKAVELAVLCMTFQRQTYKFDASMYDRGVYNAKTTNAKQKYDQLTQAMELFKSLVSPLPAAAAPGDTNPSRHSEAS